MKRPDFNTKKLWELYSIITGNTDTDDIDRKLSRSYIYSEVRNGNEAYGYEGFISNLRDIADELKKLPDCPAEIKEIDQKSISDGVSRMFNIGNNNAFRIRPVPAIQNS